MIDIKGLCKSYGTTEILKNLDLHIEENEFVGIVGGSGAGKSTLMHIIGTLESFDKGELTINGTNIKSLKNRDLARFRNEQIGFVFQFHHLLPEFSAVENVIIPAIIKGVAKSEATKKGKELLHYLNLDHRFDHRPAELSGGEQQRVAVARAMMNEPAIILADEPTGNLDDKLAQELHALMRNMQGDFGQTILIVTHDRSLAQGCDRIVQLSEGKILLGT